jgi:sporulation protein YlmC with PRC-barrel domain
VTKQTSDQHLASKFNGTDVIGTDDAKIGDVSDVLFDKDNKVIAFIVGVGGFLGIGAKDVAIDPTSFQAVPGKDATDMKLRLSMTKDELKAAPAFEPYSAAASGEQPGTDPPDGRAVADRAEVLDAVTSRFFRRETMAAPISIGAVALRPRLP